MRKTGTPKGHAPVLPWSDPLRLNRLPWTLVVPAWHPIVWLLLAATVSVAPAKAQSKQNPSPMVETTRSHKRLKLATPTGQRWELKSGRLFVPQLLVGRKSLPVFLHFHGGNWLPEVAAERNARAAVISIQLGSGSGVYSRGFSEPGAFASLLADAEARSGIRFSQVGLTSWSAGYGAIRSILAVKENYRRVDFVVLLDGLHCSYVGGEPGPRESQLVAQQLKVFVRFARDAMDGNKQLILTHSTIFPGTYASTTETADYVLRQLMLRRTAVLKWGPMGTQQLSEAGKGRFSLLGFAGNSAPDHVDHLHALPDILKLIDWTRGQEIEAVR